ncbi:MAG: cyclic nucleotide-binding domain-containing protein [Nitrospirota bacterium]|nr:cyclic nucleotide-binding domain-containing protein [Nitrospirota bacterium]
MSKKYWETYFTAIKKQDWEQARSSLEHLSNIEQDNPQVQLKLGDIHQRLGDHIHAITSYHQSAWILTKQGFMQKALALYKIILRLDPYNTEAINRSKELMMDLESLKKQSSTILSFKTEFEEKAEQKTEAEVGLPLGIEEEAEQKIEVEPSVKIEDFIERTSYVEEPLVTTHPIELGEQEQVEKQPTPSTSEIHQGEEELTSYIPSLFVSLPEDEIKHMLNRVEPQLFSPGQMILEEGDSGDSIFFIKSGHARVVSHILGKELELATLSAGDVFGEVAFLTGRPRTASVIALDRLEVIEFKKFLLEEIFEKYPDVLKKLDDFYQCRVQDTLEKVKSKIKQ